ncbi:tRNA (adenosine(37)-N6)-threonylcarbamoyltransferase complex ATPase subunit type 1 TsaE [Rickettsiales endosymbiont of Stachyamoeba lipophora]|uniref:tRNA (adenosine(37)-N6)-threonylcarbamoyltransferase complex ATPase subunit type 1 TsaE n=1 Tax=Rickettsiales endosymbiont of Stachyamoeba lipophora TaxID=2486578 RepID=UPI000F65000F|nr:tRNA (adenosine(37)-N6)-threonylcarbamoyltransferase complex ATPase subunit type 1 TsaE [Rickettsiales endosymbiont of Stachyamoeba lipophora]AZL15381.1 tRNA (adenosine(37)-N6)-threonylcarbamoyltransferase complex ATPase subunit type 1 TsaE [Rickettsiales endosymbiont of Stachyamoeba lipophora]
MINILINSKNDMIQLAKRIADIISPFDTITLRGDLGCGKTFFTKHLITTLIPEVTEVTSPTFLIVQNYRSDKYNIHHYDLYRLKNPLEIIEIGLEENLDTSLNIIEWPEIIEEQLPEDRLDIYLTHQDESKRQVNLDFKGTFQNNLLNFNAK